MKNIFVVENSKTEMERAAAAITAAGHLPIVTRQGHMNGAITMGMLFESIEAYGPLLNGVVTDLMFNPGDNFYWEQEFPCGLTVAMWCRERCIPVVVCTSAGHEKMADWAKDALTNHLGVKVEKEKNWDRAVKLLETQMS